jgi:hypothetical protein
MTMMCKTKQSMKEVYKIGEASIDINALLILHFFDVSKIVYCGSHTYRSLLVAELFLHC